MNGMGSRTKQRPNLILNRESNAIQIFRIQTRNIESSMASYQRPFTR
jgi:hypothetical protein